MALNEAREKVSQLENAIKRLDFVKKHLSRNASDIKREIHSCVSRNLECLRGREVALLSEVDEVLSIKEEALHQQQAHLNQALGVLQSGLTMMKDDSSSEKQLRETILKLNRMELSPGETPHIAFRADHISLKESIMKYGRVDANGLSFAAFEDPDIPSASLPRHLEDYEDVDHHVFNKPVQEIDTGNSMSSITVTIPKLSNRMEDWLQKRLPSSKSSVASPVLSLTKLNPSFISQPPSSKSGKEPAVSCSSTPSDACSLNNWLSLIKNHADLEEEHDFEIVDHSNGKEGNKVESDDRRGSTADFFSHVEKDLKLWIKSASNDSNEVQEGKESNFFRHVPRETEVWLSKASQQLHSLEEPRETDFFNHISKQPSTWLRSRALSKHQVTPSGGCKKAFGEEVFKFTGTTDLSQWLAGKKPSKASPKKTKTETDKEGFNIRGLVDQDKWLHKTSYSGCCSPNDFQLEEICRANELCASPSECVSQPNCAVFCQMNSSVKNAIDPQTAFKPLMLSIDKWLNSDTEKPEEATPNIVLTGSVSRNSQMQHRQDLLFAEEETAQPTANFKHNKEETNQWLRESHMSVQMPLHQTDNCDLLSVYSGSSISDWLMTPVSSLDGKSFKERDQDTEKESSEGWSLCSSPSSTNGDQFTKDVEIAADYMKKWIL